MMAWKTGAVAIVQRFGGALNLNVHSPNPQGSGRATRVTNGFDLHAGLCVPADQRDRLERICRYALRPHVAQERLHLTDAGQVQLGAAASLGGWDQHLLFDPVGLLERLAALTPRPRINLILYHGVLAPHAAWRSLVVQFGTTDGPNTAAESTVAADAHPETAGRRHGRNYLELMRRSMGLDVVTSPRCGGPLPLIAMIDDPAVAKRVSRHLVLTTEIPKAPPGTAPLTSARRTCVSVYSPP